MHRQYACFKVHVDSGQMTLRIRLINIATSVIFGLLYFSWKTIEWKLLSQPQRLSFILGSMFLHATVGHSAYGINADGPSVVIRLL